MRGGLLRLRVAQHAVRISAIALGRGRVMLSLNRYRA